jgi:hypothetical protein
MASGICGNKFSESALEAAVPAAHRKVGGWNADFAVTARATAVVPCSSSGYWASGATPSKRFAVA